MGNNANFDSASPDLHDDAGEAAAPLTLARARRLLACAVAAGDVSDRAIHRFTGVSMIEAQAAIELCRQSGLVDGDDSIDQSLAIGLIDELPLDLLLDIRSKAARSWIAIGPDHFLTEVSKARSLGGLLPIDELVELADRSGQLSLSLHDYRPCADLFRLAMEFDVSSEPVEMAKRMCALATALDGLGNVSEARELLARAATLGYMSGDHEVVAEAAVLYSLPVDWYAGDSRAIALLDRAASMDLKDADDIRVLAARALVEMRIPITPVSDQQIAWVTRPQVAHALAHEALERSASQPLDVRAFTSLAWRTIHRAPHDLDKRREISRESINLAQMLRLPTYQVESAVWLAVDAIESSDRPLYDEALSVARWVAERDGNPRLIWRARTLLCGAAHMEGDIDEAEHWRTLAREIGQTVSSPGWLAADLLLLGQTVVSADDHDLLVKNLLDEDSPALVNPVGRAVAAVLQAEVGNPDAAERMIQKSMRQFDMESSYLLLATRCADVALRLSNQGIADELISVLRPWRGHVAVDSNGWWIDGPVDLWLASLLFMNGRMEEASVCIEEAANSAQSLGDARSLRKIAELRDRFDVTRPETKMRDSVDDDRNPLSERQRLVLAMMSKGLTNREIADELSFSVSTIRNESMAIYKGLGVKGRVEAISWFARSGSDPR